MREMKHANALRLGDRGILITGVSGAGKSVLTLALLERSGLAGRGAMLVGDDYVYLETRDNRLLASAAVPIAGALEIRGAGLFEMAFEEQVKLDLVVELADQGERYPEGQFFEALGIRVPKLCLPRLGTADCLALCHAVEATLFKTPWREKNF